MTDRWQTLRDKYPKLLGDIAFECNDGWYHLINDLCQQLVKIASHTRASQIKEKYGGLRFYVDSTTDAGYDLIDFFEDRSYHICEICGADGKRRTSGWHETLCDYHYNNKEYPWLTEKNLTERTANAPTDATTPNTHGTTPNGIGSSA